MAIVLAHTIVPVKNKITSAQFCSEIFGLTIKLGQSDFAQVKVSESLTFDFANHTRFDRKAQRHHYAFHVTDAEFKAIFGRVQTKGIPYGSRPCNHIDGQIYTRRGGRRGFYFEDPNGHLLEVMTVPETGARN